jgi:hypothetical protein
MGKRENAKEKYIGEGSRSKLSRRLGESLDNTMFIDCNVQGLAFFTNLH